MYRPLNGELGWTYIPIGLGNTSFPGTTDRARPAGRVEMSLNWAWPGNIAPCRPLKGIIRPHRNTVQVVTRCGLLLQTESRNSAQLCSCRSVCHDREPCINHWTDRDVVLDEDLVWIDLRGLKEACVRYMVQIRMIRGNLTCNNSLPWVEQQIAQLSQRDRATI